MYQFHRFVRGWNDIGYNFVIDLFGRIWEARKGGIDLAVVGAQAGGYNQQSTGVSVLGTFSSVVPSGVAIDALERLLSWKLALHGMPVLGKVTVEVNPSDFFFTPFRPGARVSLPRVAGHRDGCTTDCPGNALYAELPSIRPRIDALTGPIAKLTLGRPAKPLDLFTISTPAGAPFTVEGRLTTLGGAPIPDAQVELQKVGPAGAATITTAVTGNDGSWSALLAVPHNALVRALHRAAPTTTSDLAFVGAAPVVSLALDSSAPIRVSGTVSPPKRHVTVTVYGVRGGHRRLVASRRVAVRGGIFRAGFRSQRPGSYVLVARTAADAHNIAGSSKPVAF
jgi:hypothetical protein